MKMKGIDVSSYQGDIDFEQVKNSGIEFVIIKAGVSSRTDTEFENNYQKAKEAGLHIGFYWYCYGETLSEISEEADACINALEGKQFDFPIYMDIEEKNQFDLGKEFCSNAVRTFCEKLKNAGYYPGLYTSTSYLDSVIDDDVKAKYTIWVADWRGYCGYSGEYGMWQYGAGYVPGVGGKTELNVFDIGYDTDYPGSVVADGVDLDYAYKDFPLEIVFAGLNNYPKLEEDPIDDSCKNVDNNVNIKGIVPAQNGDNWFLIDKSGKFTLETLHDIKLNVYLVGGGEDGAEWFYVDSGENWGKYDIKTKSRGGCVCVKQIQITGSIQLQAIIAERNNAAGTSLKIGNDIYKCTDEGYIQRKATANGKANIDGSDSYNGENGANGVKTPYGYVGSSGGGGGDYSFYNSQTVTVYAGQGGVGAGNGGEVRQNGADAVNYGCGGGSAGFGGFTELGDEIKTYAGIGMSGCVIFEIVNSEACGDIYDSSDENNGSYGCSCECPHHEFTCPDIPESFSSCEKESNYKLEYDGTEPVITENTVSSLSGESKNNEIVSSNKNVKVNVSGIIPALSGTNAQYGNWFLIDRSGEFSIDRSVIATIWLVGGGCDGTAGIWNGNNISEEGKPIINTGTGTSYSGNGGDGGSVFVMTNVKIPKNQKLSSVIAPRNDKNGTSLTINEITYNCNHINSTYQTGGEGGNIPKAPKNEEWADQSLAVLSKGGANGVKTPYGYVGSSGGGGAVCNGKSNAANGVKGGEGAGDGTNHRNAGTNAKNYGCGGGGGAICGWIAEGQKGGLGKEGCIIIAYLAEEKHAQICECSSDSCSNNHSCGCGTNTANSRCISFDVEKWGENWLLFNKSGEYSLTIDEDINLKLYLVGGGADGKDGIYYNKTAYGGDGGRGGCYNVISDIKLEEGQLNITVKIGGRGEYGGTSVIINNNEYTCTGDGSLSNDGGFQGICGKHGFRQAGNGANGIETPFGYIGSSGGGGAAYCNSETTSRGRGGLNAGNGGNIVNGKSTPGSKASGYGCGGGGGAASSTSWCEGGKGKQGCVIFSW